MPQPFEFRIVEHIATLSDTGGGYTKELNRVAYRDFEPKLDLRQWHNGQPMKGVTLTEEEARLLYDALAGQMTKGKVSV